MTLLPFCSRNSAREFLENTSRLVLQPYIYLTVKTETLREACDCSFCLLISGIKSSTDDFTSLVGLSDHTSLCNSFLSEFLICLWFLLLKQQIVKIKEELDNDKDEVVS